VRNSRLLLRKAFIEYQIGFTIYHVTRGYLFFFDSQGLAPPVPDETPRVDSRRLQRLFDRERSLLTTVSLLNTDLSQNSVRRRSLRARSVADLVPDLADHAQYASTIRGFGLDSDRRVERYVGFRRGRVRDRAAGDTNFDDYISWLERIAELLDDDKR